MKMTDEYIETSSQRVYWKEIDTLKLLNQKVMITLKDNNSLQIEALHPGTIDELFKIYENYLRKNT